MIDLHDELGQFGPGLKVGCDRARCKLCLQHRELQQSHLLPASIYRRFRSRTDGRSDSICVRNQDDAFEIFQTSKQITGHVLCSTCEQSLSFNGEDWVIPQLSSHEGFPLFENLRATTPEAGTDNLLAYVTARETKIRSDKLIHFAAGIFWKAAVFNWPTGRGTLRIDLGPYGEALRKFRGGNPFPSTVHVLACVVPPSLPTISAYAPRTQRVRDFYLHSFYVPGIAFFLVAGNRPPNFLRAVSLSSNPDRPILVGSFPAEFIATNIATAFERGRIPTKVAQRLQRAAPKSK